MDEVNDAPIRKLSTCMDSYHRLLHHQPHNRDLCKPQQRFKPAVRHGFSGVPGGGGAGSICNCGAGKSWSGRSSIYPLDLVQAQIEASFMGERAPALQNRLVLNWLSHRTGQAGTGIFLPRVSSGVAKNQDPRFVEKGPRTNYLQEFYLPPQKMLLNNRQDEHRGCYVAVDDMHMPYYWNY